MTRRPSALAWIGFPPLLLVAGCRTAQTTLKGYGPASSSIAVLSWTMTILFLVLTVVMWGLIAWAFARRGGTLAEHAPIDSRGGQMWIAIGGLAVPLIVLTILFVLGLKLLTDFPIHGTHDAMTGNEGPMRTMKPDILVIGHQWWWEVHYLSDDPSLQFTTANEIHLPLNLPVNIEVRTHDVMHSFWVPALHGKVDLIPGRPNYIRLQGSTVGTFTGECSTFCGEQHAHMRLTAVVQSPSDYQAWLQAQRQPGMQPSTPAAVAGQETFLAGPCSMCHQVRGTVAGGTVGPDLTHIGSRKYIAANSYQNNNGYLEAWITHAQSLKPGVLMPNLTQFSGVQLQNLVAYLRQLQ